MQIKLKRRRQPAARVRWGLVGWCVITACLLATGGCGGTPTSPTPVQRPPVEEREPQFIKYEGSVFEPMPLLPNHSGRYWGPFGITGIPGARVTIIGGQVDGWTAVTDREGRFTWQDYPECALDSAECRARRFRVEAAGYITQEALASDPYRYRSSSTLDYSTSEKHFPMSLEWPADPPIQRMLRDLPAMSPLWLVERRERHGAGYGGGIIWTSRLEWSTMLAHEYCHAHQDWADNPDTYGLDDRRWAQSPEGTAYREAYAVDRLTNDPWLRSDRTNWRGWVESAADICGSYFFDEDRRYMQERLPNLYAWAKEWLRHR